MDDTIDSLIELLKNYEEISNIIPTDSGALFELNYNRFLIELNDQRKFPTVYLIGSEREYPHFSHVNESFDGQSAQKACLYDEGTIVEYIFTLEEKINYCIERLISLMNLTEPGLVAEYQKEFSVYWLMACADNKKSKSYIYELFLDNEKSYQWLKQIVKNGVGCIRRITNEKRYFNDSNINDRVERIPVLYLPIRDSRGIVPPTKNRPWGAAEINEIINGLNYSHIDDEAYVEISGYSYKFKSILIVFKLKSYIFGCRVLFRNSGVMKLNVALQSKVEEVIPIVINRCDFLYLNNQIGNRVNEDTIAVVGIGSLGSYIADELAHAGYRHLVLIDGDILAYENVFRHRHTFIGQYSKSQILSTEINKMHPEMKAEFVAEYLTSNNINELLERGVSAIIFTVGNSDVQLVLNKKLFSMGVSIPIYYAWLEYDGTTSHVAAVRSFEQGCYECLFTDDTGCLCPNKINRYTGPVEHIRNGCGGVRVPYGNKTLLTASALVLKAISDTSKDNKIYSYVDEQMVTSDFPHNQRCGCCGIQ